MNKTENKELLQYMALTASFLAAAGNTDAAIQYTNIADQVLTNGMTYGVDFNGTDNDASADEMLFSVSSAWIHGDMQSETTTSTSTYTTSTWVTSGTWTWSTFWSTWTWTVTFSTFTNTTITNTFTTFGPIAWAKASSNGGLSWLTTNSECDPLPTGGVWVAPHVEFDHRTGTTPNSFRGAGDKYISVRFSIAGAMKYGWIRVNVNAAATQITIKDYAYQDDGTQIKAGEGGPCVLLPVEFSAFSAFKEESTSVVNWTTATEIDNDRFIVERSSDNKNFKTIGMVPGNGNTNESVDYSFTDESPLPGYNYYRLKQVDYNGQFEYSRTGSVFHTTEDTFTMHQDGSEGHFKIQFNNAVAVRKIEVFAFNGQLLFSEELGSQAISNYSLSLPTSQALYLVKVTTNNGTTSKIF